MKELKIDLFKEYKDYLVLEGEKINIVFSTAKNNRSFNRNTEDGIENLNNLKMDFEVDEVVYLKQIHSDSVYVYNGDAKGFNEQEGDAIITNNKNVIIGAFTADCVPVIALDESKKVIGAIHSGWRGTFNSITKKTIEKMIKDFKCDVNDIKVYIGPHIRKCCYEVSEELKEKFIAGRNVERDILFKDRNLNMESCILEDLKSLNILDENIYSLSLCTYCEENIKLHSYRRAKGDYGRLFSFIYIKR